MSSAEFPLYELKNFSLSVGGRQLFLPVDLQIHRRMLVRIAGENGVGKSTLLKYLAGLPVSFTGYVRSRHNPQKVLLISQLHGLKAQLPYSLGEVAELVASRKGNLPARQSSEGSELFETVHWFAPEIAQKAWNHASGGERMRAMLAGAFLSGAEVLLLDEPFNHLDARGARLICDAMCECISSEKSSTTAIIFVAHEQGMKMNDGLGQSVATIELKSSDLTVS